MSHLDLFSVNRHSVLSSELLLGCGISARGGASHLLARAKAHMLAARVPTPTASPDGLCQGNSAASLTPQQLLGQGCARTQLARVPAGLGAAGMLGGTEVGGVVLPWRPSL